MGLRPLEVCIPGTEVEEVDVAHRSVELDAVLLEQITGTADITDVAHTLAVEVENDHRILDTATLYIDVCRLYNDGNGMFLALFV